MELVVYVLIFVAAFLAVEGLLLLLGSREAVRKARGRRRLRQLAGRIGKHQPQEGSALLSARQSLNLIERAYSLLPAPRSLELTLYRAGVATSPARFLAIMLLTGLGAVTAGMLAGAGAMGPLLGFAGLLPWIAMRRRAAKRMLRFEAQFPEALELMSRALRAGHSLTFAFQLIGDELADPVGVEFAHIAEEIKLGQDVRVALGNLGCRIDVPDLPYFVTAVLVQRETGGNLAELLDSLGYVIRDRLKLHAKVRSLTAVGKMTANILGLWPLLMVVLLAWSGADFVGLLWTTQIGHILVGCAALLVVSGYFGCRRAAQIQV